MNLRAANPWIAIVASIALLSVTYVTGHQRCASCGTAASGYFAAEKSCCSEGGCCVVDKDRCACGAKTDVTAATGSCPCQVAPTPATVPPTKTIVQPDNTPDLGPTAEPLSSTLESFGVAEELANFSPVSGPPLRVLYCTWLN